MTWPSFADVLGQDEAVARLRREADAGRLAHAYLFEGMAGSGKSTLARSFAAFLFCLSRKGGSACGECRPCRLLASGNHPDYLELPREPERLAIGRFVERPGGAEAVEHTPLLAFLRLKPAEGARRVAVVPEAERMGDEPANAFLKTLEEPPGDSILILTTNSRDRLPPTIVSRCRRIGMRPLAAPVLAGELARRGLASGPAAAALALAAEGSLGAAIGLAGDDTLELWRWLEEEAFAVPGPVSARNLADRLAAYGAAGPDNQGKRKNALAGLDLAALALRRRLRAGLPPDRVEAALAACWEAGERIVRNVKPELVLLSAAFDVMAALRG